MMFLVCIIHLQFFPEMIANQTVKGTEVQKNLKKIKKSKKKLGKKLLAQKVKECDPNSLETVFKKKKNRKTKHKNKDKLNKNNPKAEAPVKEVPDLQSPEAVSSNWKNLLKNLSKAEDEGAKPKAAFVRRNKKGQLITNQLLKHPKAVQVGQKKNKSEKLQETQEDDEDDVWFDDVDPMLLDGVKAVNNTPDALVKVNGFTGITKILGMDCEMVGVGMTGTDSILARVSIVNHFGHMVYDKFVAPREKVCPLIIMFFVSFSHYLPPGDRLQNCCVWSQTRGFARSSSVQGCPG